MPRDPEAEGALLGLTVKAALGPVLERVAELAQQTRELRARIEELTTLRDRMVAVETKQAAPVQPDAAFYELRERMAAIETKPAPVLDVPADVLLRLSALEVRPQPSVTQPPVDLAPVLDRIGWLEIDTFKELSAVRERMAAVETKAAPVVEVPSEVLLRLSALEVRKPETAVDLSPALDRLSKLEMDVVKDMGAVRERLAVVETKAPIAGPPGQNGADGANGKDGADGMGYDELTAVQNDDRSFTLKAIRGDRVKDIGTIVFPVEIYRGVYLEGKSYERGDCATWGGSEWHCNEPTTTKPGDGSSAWTLKVKRGRDGKDGKDAPQTAVVTVR
jgi:hypothetical protein